MWLNLYGCEAVQHKLKHSLKPPKMHILSVFEFMLDKIFCQKSIYSIWHFRLWSFQVMKLPNFENWSNGELSKIGYHFSNKRL